MIKGNMKWWSHSSTTTSQNHESHVFHMLDKGSQLEEKIIQREKNINTLRTPMEGIGTFSISITHASGQELDHGGLKIRQEETTIGQPRKFEQFLSKEVGYMFALEINLSISSEEG